MFQILNMCIFKLCSSCILHRDVWGLLAYICVFDYTMKNYFVIKKMRSSFLSVMLKS